MRLEELCTMRMRYDEGTWLAPYGEHEYVGFGAQTVRRAIPEAVFDVPDGRFLSVQDQPILGALVNAIRELARRVAELEEEVL